MTTVYESPYMHKTLGPTLRPGGFDLTQKAVAFCELDTTKKVLDVGCGMGATIEYLHRVFGINAMGIDPSDSLLSIAQEKNPWATLIKAQGEDLRFDDHSFDCLFAECTLSLMNDLSTVLHEAYRVLRLGGWFVITDVYAQNPSEIGNLEEFGIRSCMRGLHDLSALQTYLESIGFRVALLEDCSEYLKSLMMQIIFEHGSMEQFWRKTTEQGDSASCCFFSNAIKRCKPGYFILIAQKGE